MINDWKQPVTGKYLFSSVGLINFYHQFASYLGLNLKPLRRLCRIYYRQPILMMALTLDIIDLFHELKFNTTSSMVLSCFEPKKSTF